MLLLGVVNEIYQLEATVSLPFNMRGTVGIGDISDHITTLVEREAKREEEEEEEGKGQEEEEEHGVSVCVCRKFEGKVCH